MERCGRNRRRRFLSPPHPYALCPCLILCIQRSAGRPRGRGRRPPRRSSRQDPPRRGAAGTGLAGPGADHLAPPQVTRELPGEMSALALEAEQPHGATPEGEGACVDHARHTPHLILADGLRRRGRGAGDAGSARAAETALRPCPWRAGTRRAARNRGRSPQASPRRTSCSWTVVVVADPDAHDEVRGHSDEPRIAEILAGAGLAPDDLARHPAARPVPDSTTA